MGRGGSGAAASPPPGRRAPRLTGATLQTAAKAKGWRICNPKAPTAPKSAWLGVAGKDMLGRGSAAVSSAKRTDPL